jgi:hypothetical protein
MAVSSPFVILSVAKDLDALSNRTRSNRR